MLTQYEVNALIEPVIPDLSLVRKLEAFKTARARGATREQLEIASASLLGSDAAGFVADMFRQLDAHEQDEND